MAYTKKQLSQLGEHLLSVEESANESIKICGSYPPNPFIQFNTHSWVSSIKVSSAFFTPPRNTMYMTPRSIVDNVRSIHLIHQTKLSDHCLLHHWLMLWMNMLMIIIITAVIKMTKEVEYKYLHVHYTNF